MPQESIELLNSSLGGQWYSILPPLIAIIMAFITRKLLLSLGSAIVLGGFLFALQNTSPHDSSYIFSTISNSFHYFFDNVTNIWNLKILGFVLCILTMISVIIVAGGLKGIVKYLLPYAKTSRSAQLITAFTGLIVFIDDYANTMIVGSSMRSITDQFNVSREKLAFIIDATSAPVSGLAIISTWIGFEVGLFGDVSTTLNIGQDGYSMFFDAFAFRFYCIFMLAFVFINIYLKRDFGSMHIAQTQALNPKEDKNKQNENLDQIALTASFNLTEPDTQSYISSKTALIPFGILFSVLFIGFWIDGGGISELQNSSTALLSFDSWRHVITNTKNSSSILLLSAFFGLVSSVIIASLLAKTQPKIILKAIKTGAKSSLLPAMVLLLAWSLKSVCDDLNTGEYIVTLLSPHLSPLWFPPILFFIAAITAFGTGTSWGTMSILIPIAIPVAYALDDQTYGLVTIISLGAVLDGAIFGDHCSPISDTTIMSSIAAQCDHIQHVKTQVPYSLYIACIALFLGYIPAAMGTTPLISYIMGIIILTAGLLYLGRPILLTNKSVKKN